MNKHTPGEWQRNIKPAAKYPTVFVGRNKHVFAVLHDNKIPPEEQEANHDLIIAAPDLLAALESLMKAYGHPFTGENGNSGECWDLARAALQKARGS